MADDVTLGPDRVELMRELTRIAFEVSQLSTPLDEAQFNWQPDGGKSWSVGQCLDHLVRANRCYLDALEEAAHGAREEGRCPAPPLAPGRLGRWFLATLEPPVGSRFEAPAKILPLPRCPRQATLVAFAGEQQRLIELVQATACIDCNAVKFRNPLAYGLRVFNLATGLLVIPAHERRHLAQARRVVEHPNFPRAA